MTNRHEAANMNADGGKAHPAVEFEIDVNRVVWDPEYRREVLAEIRRRSLRTDAGPKRGKRPPGREGGRRVR